MIDEHAETQASLYVLGALPGEEARAFEAALPSEPALRELVQELRVTAAALPAAFPRVEPPAGAKAGILAAVVARAAAPRPILPVKEAPVPGWMDWMPWVLAACFAVLCIVLISVGKNLHQRALSLSRQLGERTVEVEDFRDRLEQLQAQAGTSTTNFGQRLLDIEKQALARIEEMGRKTAALTNQLYREQSDLQRRLAGSESSTLQLARDKKTLEEALQALQLGTIDRFKNAKVAVLHPTPDGPPGAIGASVWLPQDQRGLIALEKLPAIVNSAAQEYQLWLFEPGSPSPTSAGVFVPDASGSVRFSFTAVKVKTVDRFSVSVEPKGGAPRPTGKMVLTGG